MSHQLETIIGYKFKNPELLEIALTHTSYANESRTPVKHNERLEFLGDSVLQIVSADYLFHAYADRPEGDLTRIRASLVSEGALFQFAQEIDLGEYLRLGRGEERCGGRTRPSVVSDAFEAVIAALYLDGGMEVAKGFILPFITEGKHAEADYKTRLQEIVQQSGYGSTRASPASSAPTARASRTCRTRCGGCWARPAPASFALPARWRTSSLAAPAAGGPWALPWCV